MNQRTVEKLKTIDRLIKIKGTGTPAQLARRIGVSDRSIYYHLNLIRELGALIEFDNFRQTYYYKDEDFSLENAIKNPSQQAG